MLAANIWHWWIGVVVTAVAVITVVMLAAGYLKQVTATRYPNRRQRQD
jgi:putative intracellular protease/amidase